MPLTIIFQPCHVSVPPDSLEPIAGAMIGHLISCVTRAEICALWASAAGTRFACAPRRS